MNYYDYFPSPVGWLELCTSDKALLSIHFMKKDFVKPDGCKGNELTQTVRLQLNEYFAGKRRMFDIPLSPAGTDFQLRVWNELQKIPYGKTINYLQLAERIGSKEYTRAVGLANGKNPVAIIIPCHRVIGSNGELTGYAGGMHRKQWLLELEAPQKSLFKI